MTRTIIVMIAIWAVIMGVVLFWPPVRVRYWGWRLARAQSTAGQEYYANRIASYPRYAATAARSLVSHANPQVRRIAAEILGLADDPNSATTLTVMLSDEDIRVRDAAALALGRRPDADLVPRLGDLATGRDGATAAAAVFALQRSGAPASIDAILEALKGAASPEVRAQAAESLGLLNVQRAAPLLSRILSDQRRVTTRPANERAAWRALMAQRGRLGVSATAIAQAMGQADKTVADYARDALHRLEIEARVGSRRTSQYAPSTSRSASTAPAR